jgi:hypothetical protein
MRLKLLLLLSGTLLMYSCAANKPGKTTVVNNPVSSGDFYLPGIDSTVVKDAIKFSDRIIVDFDRQKNAEVWHSRALKTFELADSLNNCLRIRQDEDSTLLRIYESWTNKYDVDRRFSKLFEEIKPERFDQIVMTVLDSAYHEASRAKLLNPYNLDIRSLLINIYLEQGEITGEAIYYNRAIDELNNFLLVDKSNPYIYEKLGECFCAFKDWENCYRFFHEAETILKITAKFNSVTDQDISSSLDTTRLVYYLHRQGEAKTKMHDSEQAIYYLKIAKQLSESDEIKRDLQNFLDWINWDGGNIRASEIRDEIVTFEKNNDYKKARTEYIELLKIMKTQQAKNEINWKIASIEYNFLGRKKEALERLFHVIQTISKSEQNNPQHTVYSKDYAAMCYSIGMEHLNKNRLRLAYIYFNQAAQIDWDHRGECFFQMAVLSRANPSETIRSCKLALDFSQQLSENINQKISEMLAIAYKQMGEFEIAHTYFKNLMNPNHSTKN